MIQQTGMAHQKSWILRKSGFFWANISRKTQQRAYFCEISSSTCGSVHFICGNLHISAEISRNTDLREVANNQKNFRNSCLGQGAAWVPGLPSVRVPSGGRTAVFMLLVGPAGATRPFIDVLWSDMSSSQPHLHNPASRAQRAQLATVKSDCNIYILLHI